MTWQPAVHDVRAGCGHHHCRGWDECRYVEGTLGLADEAVET